MDSYRVESVEEEFPAAGFGGGACKMRVPYSSMVAWLLAFSAAPSIGAAPMEMVKKTVASHAFGMYQVVFGDSPEQWGEELERMLKKDGFISSGSTWVLSNDTGEVLINAFPRRQLFLRFRPIAPVPVGDATLAAHIAKADGVTISSGDTIDVALATRAISKGGNSCKVVEHLTFKLGGGLWSETGVVYDCTVSK